MTENEKHLRNALVEVIGALNDLAYAVECVAPNNEGMSSVEDELRRISISLNEASKHLERIPLEGRRQALSDFAALDGETL